MVAMRTRERRARAMCAVGSSGEACRDVVCRLDQTERCNETKGHERPAAWQPRCRFIRRQPPQHLRTTIKRAASPHTAKCAYSVRRSLLDRIAPLQSVALYGRARMCVAADHAFIQVARQMLERPQFPSMSIRPPDPNKDRCTPSLRLCFGLLLASSNNRGDLTLDTIPIPKRGFCEHVSIYRSDCMTRFSSSVARTTSCVVDCFSAVRVRKDSRSKHQSTLRRGIRCRLWSHQPRMGIQVKLIGPRQHDAAIQRNQRLRRDTLRVSQRRWGPTNFVIAQRSTRHHRIRCVEKLGEGEFIGLRYMLEHLS
jgi:hypothetical protein